MHKLISTFEKTYGIKVGVAAEAAKWTDQCATACNDVGTYPLYWTPTADNDPSFNNFKPFGGWKTPTVKVYQWSAKVCGAEVDLTYRA